MMHVSSNLTKYELQGDEATGYSDCRYSTRNPWESGCKKAPVAADHVR